MAFIKITISYTDHLPLRHGGKNKNSKKASIFTVDAFSLGCITHGGRKLYLVLLNI